MSTNQWPSWRIYIKNNNMDAIITSNWWNIKILPIHVTSPVNCMILLYVKWFIDTVKCNVSQEVRLLNYVFRKTCWVCFATEDDDSSTPWVRPCRCKGTTKWVHQLCLQRWIDEKQKGKSTSKVACPQCNTEYIIVFPKLGKYVENKPKHLNNEVKNVLRKNR